MLSEPASLHGVSDKVYRRLKDTLTFDGIMPRPHQNTIKTSFVRTHPVAMRETTVKFLENFAIQNAVVLPGRVPGFKNPDLLLLPSEFTKKTIKYRGSMSRLVLRVTLRAFLILRLQNYG